MAKLYNWDVYEKINPCWGDPWNERVGNVIAYNERHAIAIAARQFRWDKGGYPYRERVATNMHARKGWEVTGDALREYRLDQQFDDYCTVPSSHISKEKLAGIVRRHKGYEYIEADDIRVAYARINSITGRLYYLFEIQNRNIVVIGK